MAKRRRKERRALAFCLAPVERRGLLLLESQAVRERMEAHERVITNVLKH